MQRLLRLIFFISSAIAVALSTQMFLSGGNEEFSVKRYLLAHEEFSAPQTEQERTQGRNPAPIRFTGPRGLFSFESKLYHDSATVEHSPASVVASRWPSDAAISNRRSMVRFAVASISEDWLTFGALPQNENTVAVVMPRPNQKKIPLPRPRPDEFPRISDIAMVAINALETETNPHKISDMIAVILEEQRRDLPAELRSILSSAIVHAIKRHADERDRLVEAADAAIKRVTTEANNNSEALAANAQEAIRAANSTTKIYQWALLILATITCILGGLGAFANIFGAYQNRLNYLVTKGKIDSAPAKKQTASVDSNPNPLRSTGAGGEI